MISCRGLVYFNVPPSLHSTQAVKINLQNCDSCTLLLRSAQLSRSEWVGGLDCIEVQTKLLTVTPVTVTQCRTIWIQ